MGATRQATSVSGQCVMRTERTFQPNASSAVRLVEATECGRLDEGGMDVWMMLREIGPGENGFGNEGYDVPLSQFGEFLRSRVDMHLGRNLAPGRVPMTTYWLYDGPKPIAVSKLRHRLNESLRRVGGHVGYCVRPSERGKGYGTLLLGLTLVAARKRGLRRLLLTCNQDNAASRRVIERNGGRLSSIRGGVCYFWVATSQRK